VRSRRTTELLLLLAGALPALLAFALLAGQRGGTVQPSDLYVPAALLGAFALAHLAVRRYAPAADPSLLPIAFALSAVGLAFVTRLDADLAASQVLWLFAGVAALVGTLAAVPSLDVLARYKYTIMLLGIGLLVLPAFIGTEVNGAKLWIRVGGMSFQPGEIAKICIVLFLAAYLAENREALSFATRRGGVWLPPLRQLGPLLLMWLASLFVLVFERDLGSSLLLFGVFLTMLYVATGRATYVAVGLGLFGAGATLAYTLFDHVQTRIAIWIDPFADAAGRGYQLVQSLFALAAGGVIGTGLGRGVPTRIPFVETDFIFSAIAEEMGLLGGAAIVIAFLAFSLRGLATAVRARTDMAAFTAVGLVAGIAIQAFVIIGGVTRLIPLTGVTLPFMSYGGSSMLSTFIALGLLLRAGDEATGTQTEMQLTVAAGGVLGRVALGGRVARVASVLSVLLVALVVNLTWIQVVQARALNANAANTRALEAEARIDRGAITTRDGTVLARSRPVGDGTYVREYPEGDFGAHVVGYYSSTYGRAGMERAANDALTGTRGFETIGDAIDAAAGRTVQGNDVILTLDASVQRAAEAALGTRRGACIVLDPATGAVLGMASSPGFDPGAIEKEWATVSGATSAPLLNRGTQSLYPPGSTFKVVTATGALGSGVATLDTAFPGPGTLEIGGAPVRNFEGGSYGSLDLVTAMERSVNTYFAQLAVEMGPERLVAQAERFGFGKRPPLELAVEASLMPDPAEMTTWETAWAGVGQPVGEHESPPGPQATALQMALVAAGIGNGGVVMSPFLTQTITDPSGEPLSTPRPRGWTRATDAATAALVRDLMVSVVEQGSGARARVSGVTVAGKTGTAEVGDDAETTAWFIAFAPAEKPTVAMAIVLENAGVGGRVAAPAAQPVLEAALAAQGSR